MAKYSKTGMDFFFRLGYREGMLYYRDIYEMATEEAESIQRSQSAPQQLDALKSMYGTQGGEKG